MSSPFCHWVSASPFTRPISSLDPQQPLLHLQLPASPPYQLSIVTMKPSSPLSLLLFIHLASAAPIPTLSSECLRLSQCRDALANDPRAGIPPTDQDLASLGHPSVYEESLPQAKEPAEELLTPPEVDATSHGVRSTAQDAAKNCWKNSKLSRIGYPTNDDAHARVWCQQMKHFSWKGSLECSVLLVPIASIVLFFLVALIAWEAVGRSDGL